MRKSKQAEKNINLKALMNSLKPFKLDFGELPIINQNEDDLQVTKIKSRQLSPKVFINSEEALIWIKDYDQKTKHDLLQIIKKKAERELSIENSTYRQIRSPVSTRNKSLVIRKKSKSPRPTENHVKITAIEKTRHVLNQIKQQRRKKYKNPFLNIQVLEISKQKPVKVCRTKTQRSNQTVIYQTSNNQKSVCSKQSSREQKHSKNIKIRSQGKMAKKILVEQSFNFQHLTPW